MQKHSRKAVGEPGMERKKFISLKFLNPKAFDIDSVRRDSNRENNRDVFKKLERSLERDNKEEQPISEPIPVLPGDQVDTQDDTLWQVFYKQASKVASKVSSEKVNCYEREFNKMRKQFRAKTQKIRGKVECLENSTKQKYKQIHSLFEEIKQERKMTTISSTITKKKKKNMDLVVMDNSHKIVTLKDTIEGLRKQVAVLEKDISKLCLQELELKKQWIWFLRRLLREGYYLRRGVIPILEEMVQMNFSPKLSDMPACLDEVSKKCLVQEHKIICASNKPKYLHKRVNSQPKSKITGLAQSDLIRDVYKGTKQFMAEMIRQASWKEQVTLPPIYHTRQKNSQDWRENEMKRLSHVYTGEKYVRSRSIMFGPKVDSCM